jgi:hypothetical protein
MHLLPVLRTCYQARLIGWQDTVVKRKVILSRLVVNRFTVN